MSLFQTVLYQIYLLQLENFNLSRFIHTAWQDRNQAPAEFANPIDWTAKLSLVVSLAAGLCFIVSAGLGWVAFGLLASSLASFLAAFAGVIFGVLVLAGLLQLFFISLALMSIILRPFDRLLRMLLIKRARKKLSKMKQLTIVGITGSYGKTTMKQTVATLLSGQVIAEATPKSFNKPVSVARFILSEVGSDTDVLVVEMGAYSRGDIKDLCDITPPDISILTGINEAHRERFGSLETTIKTKFEIVTNSAENATVLLNADDETVTENHHRFSDDKEVEFYSFQNDDRCRYRLEDKRFHTDGTGWSFRVFTDDQELGYTKVPHLGEYIIGDVLAGLLVAAELGLDEEKSLQNTVGITPAERRLQPIQRTSSDILVIDDSYNGTSTGVKAAIDVLDRFKGRRKVFVTTGLVETGQEKETVHRTIGRQLAAVVDVVVLVDASVTDYITSGLDEADFSGEVVIAADRAELESKISDITTAGDVVLFQNDWSENYR